MTYAVACAFGKRYLIFLHEPMYHSGTPAAFISSSAPSGSPRPFRTASMILNERFSGMPHLIKYSMISSRQPMASLTEAVLDKIRSRALPSQTSVPCEKPERRMSVSNFVGCVSWSMPRVKPVPNSGIAQEPTGPKMGSFSKPRTLLDVKIDIVSLSSSGIFCASTPVKSSSMRIIVGSSWPSMSSFKRFSSIEWYSKCVVIHSESLSSAGCCTGQKSQISFSCGITTRPPGC